MTDKPQNRASQRQARRPHSRHGGGRNDFHRRGARDPKGFAQPFGSLTQMSHIRLGRRTEQRNPLIKDFVPLAGLDDLEFGGWDPYSDDAYTSAMKAGVLDPRHIEGIGDELRSVKPYDAVFSEDWVKNLDGVDQVKKGTNYMDLAEKPDGRHRSLSCREVVDRLVMVWCGSTEAYREPSEVHADLDSFVKGLKESDPTITPSQIYAYAALKMGVPFANGAPNLTVDVPAHGPTGRRGGRPDRGQGLQDRADPDEDDGRSRAQGADVGDQGMVLHQHPGQPGWRGAGRPGQLPFQGGLQARGPGADPCSPRSIPSSTATSITRSASTTTHQRVTTRRVGTASTSSGGSGTRCRSRSTSCARTRYSPPRSSSTSRCSWTSRPVPGSVACRSGSRSTSRAHSMAGPVPGERPVHPAHQAQEQPAPHDG